MSLQIVGMDTANACIKVLSHAQDTEFKILDQLCLLAKLDNQRVLGQD